MAGYYKFRCRNFYTHNCGNWVWVNNSTCAECVAAGREDALAEHEYKHKHGHIVQHETSNSFFYDLSEGDDRPCAVSSSLALGFGYSGVADAAGYEQ